jgi:4-aminobutyrate aminotransferase-like enzyme
MFMAVELVSDKVAKTPLTRKVTERIFQAAVKRGLLTMSYSASFRIQPPLTTDEATAMNGLAILREVFDEVEREGYWRA